MFVDQDLLDFLKYLIQQSSFHGLHYRHPKLKSDRQNQKTKSFFITIERSIRQTCSVFRFQNTKTCISSSKKSLKSIVIYSYIWNMSCLTIAKLITFKKPTLRCTKLNFLKAFSICCTNDIDCCPEGSNTNVFVNVSCPKRVRSSKACVEKNFKSIGRSDCQCQVLASASQGRSYLFEIDANLFLLMSDMGFIYIKRDKRQL